MSQQSWGVWRHSGLRRLSYLPKLSSLKKATLFSFPSAVSVSPVPAHLWNFGFSGSSFLLCKRKEVEPPQCTHYQEQVIRMVHSTGPRTLCMVGSHYTTTGVRAVMHCFLPPLACLKAPILLPCPSWPLIHCSEVLLLGPVKKDQYIGMTFIPLYWAWMSPPTWFLSRS